MIIKKKTDLQLSYRKAAAVQGQSVHRELKKIYIKKKSVEEKNIFCARQLMLMFAFGYMQHAIFYEKKYIRGIERRGCKDGFINFKY